jgi:hypothetical protein
MMLRGAWIAATGVVLASACGMRDYDAPPPGSVSPGGPPAAGQVGSLADQRGQGGAGGAAVAVATSASVAASGNADCTAQPCVACQQCAALGPCAGPVSGCRNDARCAQALSCLASCFVACGTDSPCITACSGSCHAGDVNDHSFVAASNALNCACNVICIQSCPRDQLAECQRGFM